jgi:hypothetical protein
VIETVTLVLDGALEHFDSAGNARVIYTGDAPVDFRRPRRDPERKSPAGHDGARASALGLMLGIGLQPCRQPREKAIPEAERPPILLADDNADMRENLARLLGAHYQPIDLERPHPFTEAGAREFNCLLWMPPNEQRARDIVLVDSTNFTTLFGGTKSLETFWANLAAMR